MNTMIKLTIIESTGWVMIVSGIIAHRYVFCALGVVVISAAYVYAFRKLTKGS